MSIRRSGVVVAAGLLSGLVSGAAHANIVTNGSLEDTGNHFVNTVAGYMTLGAGSTTIPGWTVAPGTTGSLVWARAVTDDGFSASDGNFFVDLTGLGANSPNGAIQQALSLTGGASYSFAIDLSTLNNGAASVTVGSQTIALVAGGSFSVAGTGWQSWTGSFIANPLELNPLLTVMNASAGTSIVFIDNIRVTGGPAGVPEPLTLALFGAGLVGAAGLRRRRTAA